MQSTFTYMISHLHKTSAKSGLIFLFYKWRNQDGRSDTCKATPPGGAQFCWLPQYSPLSKTELFLPQGTRPNCSNTLLPFWTGSCLPLSSLSELTRYSGASLGTVLIVDITYRCGGWLQGLLRAERFWPLESMAQLFVRLWASYMCWIDLPVVT